EVNTHLEDGAVLLTSSDGTVARFTGWFPVEEISSEDDARTQLTVVPREIAVVLLRRGGYAIGLAHVGENGRRELRAHKSGTRYVQSRTAAGGWSQQRFARRRENQAEGLVRAAADHAVRVLAPRLPPPTRRRGCTPPSSPGLPRAAPRVSRSAGTPSSPTASPRAPASPDCEAGPAGSTRTCPIRDSKFCKKWCAGQPW